MTDLIIKPKPITKENFKKFGDMITTADIKPIEINNGYAKRYDGIANLNTKKDNGEPTISIFSALKRSFPMKVDMMEKHPLGSQAFIPMEDTKFLVFVAPKGDKPDVNKIQSFLVPKQTGVNYNAGIWHFPLISMKNMNFLIVDRKGKGNNLVIYKFKKDKIILKK
jgi:ureidoglycolate lyase